MKSVLNSTIWAIIFTFQIISYGSYTILVRLSQENGTIRFSATSMNLTIELTKLLFSALGFAYYKSIHTNDDTNDNNKDLAQKWTNQLLKSIVFAIPALLYFINNNLAVWLQFYMDSTSYQILGNFKIFTTALLYYLIMGKRLTRIKWLSLLLLFVAGVLYVYGNLDTLEQESDLTDEDLESTDISLNNKIYITRTGLVMMVFYVFISGLAGVYTEFILKQNHSDSILKQNLVLYTYGSIFNLIGCLIEERTLMTNQSFMLENFNKFTWMIIVTQVYNGLCMSLIMKYSNNITKLFVISCSLLVTTILAVWVFSLQLNVYFFLVTSIILFALYLYLYNEN